MNDETLIELGAVSEETKGNDPAALEDGSANGKRD